MASARTPSFSRVWRTWSGRGAGGDGDQLLGALVALVGALQLPPGPGHAAHRHQDRSSRSRGRGAARRQPPLGLPPAASSAARATVPPLNVSASRPSAVQGLLEQDLGGHGVDPARLPPRVHAGRAQPLLGLDAGQRLVDQLQGQAGELRQALAEAADPLGGLPALAVQADGLAEDQPPTPSRAGDLRDLPQGRAVVAPLQGGERHGEPAVGVRDREPDPLLAEVDAQRAHARAHCTGYATIHCPVRRRPRSGRQFPKNRSQEKSWTTSSF